MRHDNRPRRPELAPGRHPRGEGQSEDVEEDVAARGAARWVSLGEAEAGHDLLPPPGADRGSVELECRHDDKDPCIDATACDDERRRQCPATDRTGDIRCRKHRQPHDAPAGDTHDGRRHQPAPPATGGFREREPGEVDEPVPGRHVGREVPEPVLVDAPEQRPDDLAARRDDDDEHGLAPHRGGLETEQPREQGRGADAERELPPRPSVPVDPERHEDPRGGDGDREWGPPAHWP
jgi:hypothetical protein